MIHIPRFNSHAHQETKAAVRALAAQDKALTAELKAAKSGIGSAAGGGGNGRSSSRSNRGRGNGAGVGVGGGTAAAAKAVQVAAWSAETEAATAAHDVGSANFHVSFLYCLLPRWCGVFL
jgi:hypothetical protein